MPLVARDLVGGGPITFGLLLGAFGVGAIGGGLFSSGIRQALGTKGLVRLSFAGFAVCALVTAFSSSTHLTMVVMALGGSCWVLYRVLVWLTHEGFPEWAWVRPSACANGLIGPDQWDLVLALSSFNVAVQISSPRWVVGRTLALYQTAAFGGMALGSCTWGQLTERFSISGALVLSALVHLLAVFVGLRWVLPNDEEANLEPLDRWREPSSSARRN
jgi:MFS family permease